LQFGERWFALGLAAGDDLGMYLDYVREMIGWEFFRLEGDRRGSCISLLGGFILPPLSAFSTACVVETTRHE
jgi:hypothetical protein